MTMRDRFYALAADALQSDERVAMVFAGRRHFRH